MCPQDEKLGEEVQVSDENSQESGNESGNEGLTEPNPGEEFFSEAGQEPEASLSEDEEALVGSSPLEAELENQKKENKDLNNRLLRALADYDNVRKRSEREVWNAKQYGSEDLVKRLLPVMDSFESALRQMTEAHVDKKILDGLEMLFMQFSDVLEREGLKPIKSKGEKFDPNKHEALMKRSDPEIDDEVVVSELEKGYLFKEKVIRPAKVEINQK